MQCRVKRSCIHLQQLAGAIPDRHANSIAMLRTPLQGLQNQQVQRPLQEFNTVLVPGFLLDHRFVPSVSPFCVRFPRMPLPCAHFVFVFGNDVMTRPFVPFQAVDILPPACRPSTPWLRATPLPLPLYLQTPLGWRFMLLLPLPHGYWLLASAIAHPNFGHSVGP